MYISSIILMTHRRVWIICELRVDCASCKLINLWVASWFATYELIFADQLKKHKSQLANIISQLSTRRTNSQLTKYFDPTYRNSNVLILCEVGEAMELFEKHRGVLKQKMWYIAQYIKKCCKQSCNKWETMSLENKFGFIDR